jgi:DNA (cytosine-5)-methyltransferase 1
MSRRNRDVGTGRLPALRAVDLFCGAGGLTQGLRRAGFQVIGAIDNDELAVESYRLNHRRTRLFHEDIAELDPDEVMLKLRIERGQLDLLAGCPPCQGFSSMRTHNGNRVIDDDNNDLVFQFLRYARALLPRALMMENVPALQTDARMARMRAELRHLGYKIQDDVLDASAYGVPQRRRRYILLGLLDGRPNFGAEAKRRRTVRGAIGRLPRPGQSGDALHDVSENRAPHVAQLIADIPPDGGSRSDLDSTRQLPCHVRSDGWKDVFGRMAWDDVSPTITGGCVNPSKGRFLHPEQHRAITLREAALLQSFPPAYRFSLKRGKFATAQLIGNALPPRFIERHARALREQLAE